MTIRGLRPGYIVVVYDIDTSTLSDLGGVVIGPVLDDVIHHIIDSPLNTWASVAIMCKEAVMYGNAVRTLTR